MTSARTPRGVLDRGAAAAPDPPGQRQPLESLTHARTKRNACFYVTPRPPNAPLWGPVRFHTPLASSLAQPPPLPALRKPPAASSIVCLSEAPGQQLSNHAGTRATIRGRRTIGVGVAARHRMPRASRGRPRQREGPVSGGKGTGNRSRRGQNSTACLKSGAGQEERAMVHRVEGKARMQCVKAWLDLQVWPTARKGFSQRAGVSHWLHGAPRSILNRRLRVSASGAPSDAPRPGGRKRPP